MDDPKSEEFDSAVKEVKDENLNLSKLTNTILKLEELDKNLYRANYSWKTDARGMFGGQIIGQALVAASKTVPHHLHVHSMHCYFLQKGNSVRPVVYQVDNLRDGTSFSTRLVNARQSGEVIFTSTVSYHKHEEALVSYQYKMPDVPMPEAIPSYEDLLSRALSSEKLSEYQKAYIHKYLAEEVSFLLKPVNPSSFGFLRQPDPREGKLLFWVKLKGSIGESSHNLHRCVAAYISDSFLLATSLLPTSTKKLAPSMMVSIDHALWFHEHFRSDEWMLYECESPRMVGNRAFCLGRIWRRDGVLAVSCAQEGVVRLMSLL